MWLFGNTKIQPEEQETCFLQACNVAGGLKIRWMRALREVTFLAVAYPHERIFATLTDPKLVKENHIEELLLREMSERTLIN